MNTSQCAVYQVKETPEYRDVRFRSYEKLRSEGKSVSIVNYQQVYIGRIQPGETPADIKIRLQKQRPKNFKGHSIGCSDVLVITDEGKTTAYYINKDGFIIVPEFLTIKSSSDTRLSIDTTGYEIEGKKGTWLAQDYILMNEKKWFLMEHEEYGTRAAYVILSEDGAVVMNDCYKTEHPELYATADSKRTGTAKATADATESDTAVTRAAEKETRAGKLAEGHGQWRISS